MAKSIYDIKYQPLKNLAYLHNPKVACSTIKNSMLFGKVENVHEQYIFPQFNNPSATLFSVVRNPYTRIVSAYLDKVGPGKDHWVWLPFCRKHNIDPESELSFKNFLEILDSDDSKEDMDHHFRPQYLNLFHGIVTPSFIGYVEEMSKVEEFLAAHGLEMLNRAPHKTKSGEKKDSLLSPECIDLIESIYSKDFEVYGYSPDPKASFDLSPIFQEQFVSENFFEQYKKFDVDATVSGLRSAALILEQLNLEKARELMELALALRPDGSFIVEKVESYKASLSEFRR